MNALTGNFDHRGLNHADAITQSLLEDHRATDRLMLRVLIAHWVLASTAIGYMHGFYALGFVAGGVIVALAFAARKLLAGHPSTRIVMGLGLVAFSMLFIQQGLGRLEMHFHIFVALAILARYKDVRPIVVALLAVLVHHLTLNVCQQFGLAPLGVPLMLLDYGTNLNIVLFLHGVPAIAETVVLGIFIYQLRQQYCLDMDKALDNEEVIRVLERAISQRDDSARLDERSRYAGLLNELMEILSANNALRNAIDNTDVGIVQCTPDLVVTGRNCAADRLLASCGLSTDSLATAVELAAEEFSATSQTDQTLNLRVGDDSNSRSLRVRFNPVLNGAGETVSLVSEWHDRSELVAMERDISRILDAAQAGDLSRRIDMSGKVGFFARLSEKLNALIDLMDRSLTDIAAAVDELSNGELGRRLSAGQEGRFGEVAAGMNHTLETLSSMVERIRESSDVVTSSAERIARGSVDLSSRSKRQAQSLEETVSAIEQMNSSVARITERTQIATELSAQGASQAIDGGEVVRRTIGAMNEIQTPANRSPASLVLLMASPFKRTCWRSTRRSRPPGPASRAKALQSSPMRCKPSLTVVQRLPVRLTC